MLRCVEMCRWESCSVPARAKIRGTYSGSGIGWLGCAGRTGGEGREGMRQESGASLWM